MYFWGASSAKAGLKSSHNNHITMIPQQAGRYTIQVAQKLEKCNLVSPKAEIVVEVNALPRVNLGRDTVICELDGGLMLEVADYPVINWSDGSTDLDMFVTTKGRYSVNVMDDNGCEASDEIVIKEFCCKITTPNIINLDSWNGNNNFKVSHSGCVISSKLSVFDRWGNLMYKSDEGLLPWDGTKAGVPVELGVYAFIFTYKALDEDNREFEANVTGDVTVIR